ncbi:MAG: hypothetical protein ABWJ42_03720 [Sulfolobales archaeon]
MESKTCKQLYDHQRTSNCVVVKIFAELEDSTLREPPRKSSIFLRREEES